MVLKRYISINGIKTSCSVHIINGCHFCTSRQYYTKHRLACLHADPGSNPSADINFNTDCKPNSDPNLNFVQK